MRHGMSGRKLSRTSSQRKSLLVGLSNSLVRHEQIKTTLPRAKELRPFIEKIITLAKNGELHDRRRTIAVLQNLEVVNKLFSDIANRFKDRNGGYTRIMKYGFRTGDVAPMAIIEFVDKA
jgi:large subunit ribosomal protein L17